jgi:hypothetical protein
MIDSRLRIIHFPRLTIDGNDFKVVLNVPINSAVRLRFDGHCDHHVYVCDEIIIRSPSSHQNLCYTRPNGVGLRILPLISLRLKL